MNITVFGSGYVGLVQAAIFADVGHKIICMDVDAKRVERLRSCEIPFFEPGLAGLVQNAMDNGLLSFTTDAERAVRDSDFLFVCVGTPAADDGAADMRYVTSVADSIAEHMDKRKVVITKSTVPVGTTDKVLAHIRARLAELGVDTVGIDDGRERRAADIGRDPGCAAPVAGGRRAFLGCDGKCGFNHRQCRC